MPPSFKEKFYLIYQWIKLLFDSRYNFKKLLLYYFFLLTPFKKRTLPNSFFFLPSFLGLNGFVKKTFTFDFNFFKRLLEPETLGLRLWEYSVLLENTILTSKKILDIGTGTSLFPFYLAKKKAKVIALDLGKPMETPSYQDYGSNPKFITGSVLDLPFKAASFDLITAVSTLEHLDADYQTNQPVSRKEFLIRTKQAIKEITRVCKKGGLIYITTDFYLPSQKTDLWSTTVSYKGIGGAYQAKDIHLFLSTFSSLQLIPLSRPNFDFDNLKRSSFYSNYRGRYFTTVNFLYQKN